MAPLIEMCGICKWHTTGAQMVKALADGSVTLNYI